MGFRSDLCASARERQLLPGNLILLLVLLLGLLPINRVEREHEQDDLLVTIGRKRWAFTSVVVKSATKLAPCRVIAALPWLQRSLL